MSRTPPPRTPEQQRDADRIQALRLGTPEAMRAWAATYDIHLFRADDDEFLLIGIHEARVVAFSGQARRESQQWLESNRARIIAERETK